MPVRDDARDLVIKVKYGGTLKRFNASVNGSHFDHDLAALRSKIANAFKFSPSAEFVLTYTDDDGDIVMLDDDDDLRDAAISQKLNPLRIDVQLNSSSAGAKQQASDSRSSMSAMVEQLAQVKSAIDEALKFVPEQVPAALAKLSHELHSKAASSGPPSAQLLDRIAELIAPRSSVQPTSGLTDSSPGSSSDHLPHVRQMLINSPLSELATIDAQHAKALGLESVLAEEAKSQVGQASGYTSTENPSVLGISGGKLIFPRKKRTDAQSKGKSHAQVRGKSVVSSSVPPVPYMAHGVPTLGSAAEYERNMYTKINDDLRKMDCPVPNVESNGKISGEHSVFPPPRGLVYNSVPTVESIGKVNWEHSLFPPRRGPVYNSVPTVESNGKVKSEHSVFPPPRGSVYIPITNPSFTTPGWNGKKNGSFEARFAHPLAYDRNSLKFYDQNPLKFSTHPYGFNQDANSLGSCGFASSAYDSITQPTVHKWIECDGCGITPIVGPRYKSIVKDDYDLCINCFSLAGNEAEYTRIDKPMLVSERLRGIDKTSRLQLDCCFIKDLTVPDGTVMAPSTPFRKIWCMRNSGSTAWPSGTQLTWIGGDQFARQSSVKLGISEFGFPTGGEIDVCVDFVAPAKPGRYISYWRLTSPDLLKFGQQVWVLIQVEKPVQTSGKNDSAAINLSLAADDNSTTLKPFMVEQRIQTSGSKQTPTINLNLPAEGITTVWTDSASDSDTDDEDKTTFRDIYSALRSHQHKGSKAVGSVMPFAPAAVEPVQVPITDPDTSSTGAVVTPAGVPPPEAAALPNPISVPAPLPAATRVNSGEVPVSVPAAPSPDETFNDMEEKLLRELAEMGFRQADLNKEVLRQNEYDLQKSVDDLCGFHEWDPLLAELKELGFNDDTDVREVLGKDDEGSIIKRVAMNLLSREKDQ
ncbi:hypothetical protein QYE76_044603 [Lolium multiflorum]|uniref:Protein NBR1 homolog n=1 Tax=Lolium multiflorum TaxID=4521 RepID=A0AAD8TJH7_LOLMU|nr:hypothetical protein QYE76_044603 [Lolium multiflorum]